MRMLFRALGLLLAAALMTFGMTVVPAFADNTSNTNCTATGGSVTGSTSQAGADAGKAKVGDCSTTQTSTQNSGNICGNGNETINHVSVKTGTGPSAGNANGGPASASGATGGAGGTNSAGNGNNAQVTTYVVTTTNCNGGTVVGTSTKTVPANQLNLPGTGHPTVAAYNGTNAFLMAGLVILLAIGLGAAAWIRRKGTSAG